MKPTEHETITSVEVDQLPVNSVIRADPKSVSACGAYGIWPLTRSPDAWTYGHGIELKGPLVGEFIVLYVPAPVSPEVGDTLTREQLETLPQRSVVIDAENGAWQLVGEKWRPPLEHPWCWC